MAKKTIDSKLRIREEAQNLFREKGYSATSMRDLAQAVGVEAATLYSHIKSKEEILQSICFDIADSFFNAFEKATLTEKDAALKLTAAIEAHLQVIWQNSDAAAVFFHEWRHLSEPYLTDFKLMRRRYEHGFRKIVQEGIDTGLFNPMDVKFTVLTLFSAMNWTFDIREKQWSSSTLTMNLTTLIFNGLINKQTLK